MITEPFPVPREAALAIARQRWTVSASALRQVMASEGVTAAGVARQMGVSPSLVRNLRGGYHTGTTGSTLLALCVCLRISPEVIATRQDRGAA